MKFIKGVIFAVAFCVVFGVLFVFSGTYDISAMKPHWAVTTWLIENLRDRSIESQSIGIEPPDAKKSELIEVGVSHYHEMCRLCHGAPGFEPEEFAEGLYPSPPLLEKGEIQAELTDSEIFWIVKNGLKMTGMPAFGPTHSEKEMWGIVYFADKIPDMSTEDYQHYITGAEAHPHAEEDD